MKNDHTLDSDSKNSLKISSDEQSLAHSNYRGIDWVGMSKIQTCILDQGRLVPAELDMHVSLRSGHRGIHMSRLYALHMEAVVGKPVSAVSLDEVISQSVRSQEGISEQARLKIKYHHFRETRSLKSQVEGFRSYPIEITAEGNASGLTKIHTRFEVLYSSTCPQSAKLSKEYFKKNITSSETLDKWYRSNDIYPATPHAQRSRMIVELTTLKGTDLDIPGWISQIEENLQTVVQTAVKKSDEMEFARLNAENPMFCEDATRKIADILSDMPAIYGFKITAEHQESLHPHDAYSQINRNCN